MTARHFRWVALAAWAICLLHVPSASAQGWSFDARSIARGGVGSAENLGTKMIDDERDYRSLVIPFGLFQVLNEREIFNPDSDVFDPIRAAEAVASPFHFIMGRDARNDRQAAFVNGLRNAGLSRSLATYKGFMVSNELIGEGLASPVWGHTFKFKNTARGGFQGIYAGAGPYLSAKASALVGEPLTDVLASGVNIPNMQFPIDSNNEFQVALTVTGGYRARMSWPTNIGSGTEREGLYVAANYQYLRGFRYEQLDMAVRLNSDATGLLTIKPGVTPIVIDRLEAETGRGFALDFGVGAVISRWEFGLGVNGVANRIDWTDVTKRSLVLDSVFSGGEFRDLIPVPAPDARVALPVDTVVNLGYVADKWSVAGDVGHGYGGNSLHAGVERRLGRIEVRGGARYGTGYWNPSGGVGLDLTPRLSLDISAFGTTANIERKRQMGIAFSIRLNRAAKTAFVPPRL